MTARNLSQFAHFFPPFPFFGPWGEALIHKLPKQNNWGVFDAVLHGGKKIGGTKPESLGAQKLTGRIIRAERLM